MSQTPTTAEKLEFVKKQLQDAIHVCKKAIEDVQEQQASLQEILEELLEVDV